MAVLVTAPVAAMASNKRSRTGAGPTVEAVVDRRVGAVVRRAVAPARARAKHVNDPADHPPIINLASPATPHNGGELTRLEQCERRALSRRKSGIHNIDARSAFPIIHFTV